MPTLTVIKHFDVIKNITMGFFPRSVDLFFIRSHFSSWKNFLQLRCRDSYHDGSYCPLVHVISGTTAPHGLCTDYLDQNEPVPVFEDYVATRSSEAHSGQYLLSSGGCIDQPITLRENRSTTTTRYSSPSWAHVRYPTFIQCFRVELPLEPVRRHDTGLSFACPWASVPDLSLYPGTLHQPPASVNPALLPAISQIEMDLAIAINAIGLQPELFNLFCQPQIRMMP